MSIKTYKLIPIHIFEKMECNRKNHTNPPNRSVRDIIENNTEFVPSVHHVADEKLKSLSGEGEKIPIFLPTANELPEFSRASKLRESYDKITDILDDKTISDELKIKLYTIFKQKYDNTKNKDDSPDNKNESEMNLHTKVVGADEIKLMREIIESFTPAKQRAAGQIGEVLLNHPQLIRWNGSGDIVLPKIPNTYPLSLRRLLDIMVYANRGSNSEIESLMKIIAPIGKKLLSYIVNGKVIDNLVKKERSANYSKYISWM